MNHSWLYLVRTNAYVDFSPVFATAVQCEPPAPVDAECMHRWAWHAYQAAKQGMFDLRPEIVEDLL